MITGIRIGAFEHGPRTQGEPLGPFQPGPRPGDGAARPAPPPPSDTVAARFEHRFAVDGPPSATPGSNRVPPPRPAGTELQLPLSYEQRPPGALQADPDHPGIHTDTKGQRYIQDAQHTYAVRFDAGNGTWRVYQPDNPTRPGIAVRQNTDGRWQIHHDVGAARWTASRNRKPDRGGTQESAAGVVYGHCQKSRCNTPHSEYDCLPIWFAKTIRPYHA